MVDKSNPANLLLTFEFELDEKVAATKPMVVLYGHLETGAITDVQVKRLGINLDKIPWDVLNTFLPAVNLSLSI